MSVRRDPKTGRWFFRTRVAFANGKRDRIFGTPGVPGPYHDLKNTERGAEAAEHRAISKAMTGQVVRPETRDVPTFAAYDKPFMEGYAIAHRPASRRDKRQRLDLDILPVVGKLRLDALLQEHVDKIVKRMLDRKCGRKGINTTLAVLSSMVGYAVTNKIIADPELSFSIQAQENPIAPVALEDVQKLLDACSDARYRVAILLCADAGFRIGEVRALPWLEVNELGREVTIGWSYDRAGALSETKGWERRSVPISERLRAELKALERRGPLVFSRLDGDPLGYDAVRDRLHEIYDGAGVKAPTMPWHSLRHTFGAELARRNVPIKTIQELMGHKSIATTARYLHSSRDEKHAAIESLGSGSGRAVAPKSDTKQP
jgi:integrase